MIKFVSNEKRKRNSFGVQVRVHLHVLCSILYVSCFMLPCSVFYVLCSVFVLSLYSYIVFRFAPWTDMSRSISTRAVYREPRSWLAVHSIIQPDTSHGANQNYKKPHTFTSLKQPMQSLLQTATK